MNTRRKNLLLVLPVLIGLLFLGLIGTVELLIWLALALMWLYVFVVWGSKQSPPTHDGQGAKVNPGPDEF